MYVVLADLIAAIHLSYVSFIVVGQLAILWGAIRGWRWVRNRKFRLIHLLMIGIVAGEAAAGCTCPLTDWERQLRQAAGQPIYDGTFVSRLVNAVIVHDWPDWAFRVLHIAFACLVAGTWWFAPPRAAWPPEYPRIRRLVANKRE